jgi:hypothetical protein
MGPTCNASHVYAVIKFMQHFLQRIFLNLGDSLCDTSSKLLQSAVAGWHKHEIFHTTP